jgi:hypothetical protein
MIAAGNETGRRSDAAALGAAGWLGLAAAPTFAVMALLTCVPGADADMMCSAAHGAQPLSGMAPMYVLMSAFHSAPWLKLISRRRSAASGSSDDRNSVRRFRYFIKSCLHPRSCATSGQFFGRAERQRSGF